MATKDDVRAAITASPQMRQLLRQNSLQDIFQAISELAGEDRRSDALNALATAGSISITDRTAIKSFINSDVDMEAREPLAKQALAKIAADDDSNLFATLVGLLGAVKTSYKLPDV